MFLRVKKKTLIWGYLAVLFIASFLISFYFFSQRPRVRLGERVIFINPRAKINPRKVYHLKLWDYDWPVNREGGGYEAFLRKAVVDFQQTYPNIVVDITLLDFLDGPQRFAQALQSNLAPDVYCSAFTIPPFDYQRQIPVGFFLKKEETEGYFPSLLSLTRLYDIPCFFPRWTAPGIWIGNRELLEKTGLSIGQLQGKGWGIANFWDTAPKIPPGSFFLVGNPGYNGFFTQLAADYTDSKNVVLKLGESTVEPSGITNTLDRFAELISQGRIPIDFDSNMIGRFLAGKSIFMAGVRPILFRFLKERTTVAQSSWEPVLLPPPSLLWPKHLFLAENSVIGVYRNKFTTGYDHITAAVKLGQFLSVYREMAPYQEMMVIPAVKDNARVWGMKMGGLRSDCALLTQFIEEGTLVDIGGISSAYQETVYPVLREFLTGKISKEIAIARLISEKNLIPDSK